MLMHCVPDVMVNTLVEACTVGVVPDENQNDAVKPGRSGAEHY
jgi:hypothetical protein